MTLKEKERIPKLVLLPNSIDCRGWSLADKENTFQCYDCKGSLFYVRQEWGIVDEGPMVMQVLGWKDKKEPHLALRVIGLALFCAECSSFCEDYFKYFYPKDTVICSWDHEELDIAEHEELQTAILQFNRMGKIKMDYEPSTVKYLKREIEEYYEKKKGGIKWQKKPKNQKSSKKNQNQ